MRTVKSAWLLPLPEKYSPEKEEKTDELLIIPPHIDKNFMIVHRGSDPLNDKAYNYAIHEILKKKGYDIFHQTDVPPNALESSYQAWETISSPVSSEHLKEFLPFIEQLAQEKIKELKKNHENI